MLSYAMIKMLSIYLYDKHSVVYQMAKNKNEQQLSTP